MWLAWVLPALAQFREPGGARLFPTHECWPSASPGVLSYDLVIDISVSTAASRQRAVRESWAAAHSVGTACSVMHLFVHSIPSPATHHRRIGDEVRRPAQSAARLQLQPQPDRTWLTQRLRVC